MEDFNTLSTMLVIWPQSELKLVPLVNFGSAISTIIDLILFSTFSSFKSTYNSNFKCSPKVSLETGIFAEFLIILQNLNNEYIALVF